MPINDKPLVSIITPCYNGEKFVHRFLDSVLEQTYPKIELIFINDGSTDDTKRIVFSYKHKFQEKKIELIYIYQENKGVAGAINTGLNIFSGDYLCWPDSDDYLHPTSIEKRMLFLENNQQYGCVSSDANVYDENNLNKPLYRIANSMKNKFDENHFLPLLNRQSIFCPGCHMIRSRAFLDVNPKRKIYPARRGQNWQMLLPIYYKYKRAFIDEPLYNYIIYKNSMSRGDNTLEKKLFRCNEHEEILFNTLSSINMRENEREKYLKLVKLNFIRTRLLIAYQFKNKKLLEEQYHILKVNSCCNENDVLIYLRGKYPILDFIYKIFILPIRILRKIKRMIK